MEVMMGNRARLMKSKTSPFNTFYCFFFFTFSIGTFFSTIASTTTSLDHSRCLLFAEAATDHFQKSSADKEGMSEKKMVTTSSEKRERVGRRVLGGPGSSPPRCTSKCGKCSPCRPVHVPVPPGTPVTAEYYPEAWRCKCGNKLYMP